jgi:hypothetical protein
VLGEGLPTPPKAPTVGLRCGWHGQETGHSMSCVLATGEINKPLSFTAVIAAAQRNNKASE